MFKSLLAEGIKGCALICFALGHNKCLLEGDNKNLLDRMWAACACTCMCVHVTACSQLCFIASGGKLLEVCWEHLEIYKTTTKKAFHPLSQPKKKKKKSSCLTTLYNVIFL